MGGSVYEGTMVLQIDDVAIMDTKTEECRKIEGASSEFQAWGNQATLLANDHVIALVNGYSEEQPLTLIEWKKGDTAFTRLQEYITGNLS